MEPHTETPTHTNSKKAPVSLPAAILTLVVIVGVIFLARFAPRAPQKQVANDMPTSVDSAYTVLRSNDHVRGDTTKASIALIEYSDSDCPFCARLHPTLVSLVDEYKGGLVWAYRYLPLSIHPNAYSEALALECVASLGGEKAFDAYLDTIINVTLNPDPKSNETLTTLATAQGVDSALFKSCLTNPKTAARIDADMKDANTIGARGTPFNIIVNLKTGAQAIIPGAADITEFRKAIESVK